MPEIVSDTPREASPYVFPPTERKGTDPVITLPPAPVAPTSATDVGRPLSMPTGVEPVGGVIDVGEEAPSEDSPQPRGERLEETLSTALGAPIREPRPQRPRTGIARIGKTLSTAFGAPVRGPQEESAAGEESKVTYYAPYFSRLGTDDSVKETAFGNNIDIKKSKRQALLGRDRPYNFGEKELDQGRRIRKRAEKESIVERTDAKTGQPVQDWYPIGDLSKSPEEMRAEYDRRAKKERADMNQLRRESKDVKPKGILHKDEPDLKAHDHTQRGMPGTAPLPAPDGTPQSSNGRTGMPDEPFPAPVVRNDHDKDRPLPPSMPRVTSGDIKRGNPDLAQKIEELDQLVINATGKQAAADEMFSERGAGVLSELAEHIAPTVDYDPATRHRFNPRQELLDLVKVIQTEHAKSKTLTGDEKTEAEMRAEQAAKSFFGLAERYWNPYEERPIQAGSNGGNGVVPEGATTTIAKIPEQIEEGRKAEERLEIAQQIRSRFQGQLYEYNDFGQRGPKIKIYEDGSAEVYTGNDDMGWIDTPLDSIRRVGDGKGVFWERSGYEKAKREASAVDIESESLRVAGGESSGVDMDTELRELLGHVETSALEGYDEFKRIDDLANDITQTTSSERKVEVVGVAIRHAELLVRRASSKEEADQAKHLLEKLEMLRASFEPADRQPESRNPIDKPDMDEPEQPVQANTAGDPRRVISSSEASDDPPSELTKVLKTSSTRNIASHPETQGMVRDIEELAGQIRQDMPDEEMLEIVRQARSRAEAIDRKFSPVANDGYWTEAQESERLLRNISILAADIEQRILETQPARKPATPHAPRPMPPPEPVRPESTKEPFQVSEPVPVVHETIRLVGTNLPEATKRIIRGSTASDIHIAVTPQQLRDYALKIPLKKGAKISQMDTHIEGGHLTIKGEIKVHLLGSSNFTVVLANHGDGVKVSSSNLELSGRMERLGAREKVTPYIANLNELLRERLNEELGGVGKTTGFRIEGDHLVFDFEK